MPVCPPMLLHSLQLPPPSPPMPLPSPLIPLLSSPILSSMPLSNPNDTESESFCSSEKNDLIVVWCVFRSWIAVIDLFLEFSIEPQ